MPSEKEEVPDDSKKLWPYYEPNLDTTGKFQWYQRTWPLPSYTFFFKEPPCLCSNSAWIMDLESFCILLLGIHCLTSIKYKNYAQDNLGVKKALAPSKNPSNCPIMSFARLKKIISHTFQISGTLIVIILCTVQYVDYVRCYASYGCCILFWKYVRCILLFSGVCLFFPLFWGWALQQAQGRHVLDIWSIDRLDPGPCGSDESKCVCLKGEHPKPDPAPPKPPNQWRFSRHGGNLWLEDSNSFRTCCCRV